MSEVKKAAVGVAEGPARNEVPQVICVAVDGAVENVADVARHVAVACSAVCDVTVENKRFKFLSEDKMIHVKLDDYALFEKAELRPDKEQFKALVKKIKEMLKNYQNSFDYEFSEDELLELCGLIAEYCRVTRHIFCKRELPRICIDYECDERWGGYYSSSDNIIALKPKIIKKVLNERGYSARLNNLRMLADIIGHEMEHYHQHDAADEFDKKDDLAGYFLTKDEKASLNSIKKYRMPDKEAFKVAHEKFKPYIKSTELPEGYKDFDEFFEDTSYNVYYTILSEIEARDEGQKFKDKFIKKFYNFLDRSDDLIVIFVNLVSFGLPAFINYVCDSLFDVSKAEYKRQAKNFKTITDYYAVDNESLIKIAKSCSSSDADYTNAVIGALLREKEITELLELLKKSVKEGCYGLAHMLVDLIKKDAEFASKRLLISKTIKKILTSVDVQEDEEYNNFVRFGWYYCGFLTEKDLHSIVDDLVKKVKPFAIGNIIDSNYLRNDKFMLEKYNEACVEYNKQHSVDVVS